MNCSSTTRPSTVVYPATTTLMEQLIAARDWGMTRLGPREGWPQSLKTALGIVLSSRLPMILFWGRDLCVLYNEAFIPFFGGKHPEVLGRTGLEAWGEMWEAIYPMLQGVMLQDQAIYSQDPHLCLARSGHPEETYLTWSYSPITDESGGVGGVFTAVTETTERVLSERRFSTLRELGKSVTFAHAPEAACERIQAILGRNPSDIPFSLIYLLSPGGEFARLAALTGLFPGDAAAPETVAAGDPGGWPLFEVIHSGEQVVVEHADRLLGALPGGPWSEPAHTAVLLPIARAGGERPYGVLVSGVSPRRAFDEAYSSFLNLLTTYIASTFVHAEAYQAERRWAEETNRARRAKDEFFAMLGHELRNPLSPIVLSLQLMQMRGPDHFVKERAIIDRQVRHLIRLVDDLLDVSRITRGKITLEMVLVEMAEVVARAVEIISPLLEERRHRLSVTVPPGLGVRGDAMRLSQVIANLLSNAAKYTPPGGSVSVQAERQGAMICLRVKDTGMGMRKEMLDRVFDLFIQGQQGIDRSMGGLGLGLSIVRSLVALHGGSVQAQSEGPDQGSEFIVRLPAAPVSEGEAPVKEAPRQKGPAGRKVLLVEDNVDIAEALTELLADAGHMVRMAHDGPAALKILADYVPEVALLDIGLPVMDGYELAGHVRALVGPSCLLVALTGYGQEADRQRALLDGFDRHVTKPINLEALEVLLRK